MVREQYHQAPAAWIWSAWKPGGNQAGCASLGSGESSVCCPHLHSAHRGQQCPKYFNPRAKFIQPQPQQGAALIQTPVHPPSLNSVYSQQVSLGMFPLRSLPLISAGFYGFHSPDHHSLQWTVVGVCFSLTVSCGLKERVSYQLICYEFAAPWMILTGISLVPVKIPADRKEKQLCALFPSCTQTWYLHPGNNDLKRTSKTGIICHLEEL